MKNIILKLKLKAMKFILDKKGSDDKNAGTAMNIIFAIVIGGIIITSFAAYFNKDFLPTVFSKINSMFDIGG